MFSVKLATPGTLLTNALAVYYTAPAGTNMRVGAITLVNTDASSHTVSVYNAPDAGAATAAATVLKSKTLQANESYVIYQAQGHVVPGSGTPGPGGTTVASSGTIQAICDANSVVSIMISGTELTQ